MMYDNGKVLSTIMSINRCENWMDEHLLHRTLNYRLTSKKYIFPAVSHPFSGYSTSSSPSLPNSLFSLLKSRSHHAELVMLIQELSKGRENLLWPFIYSMVNFDGWILLSLEGYKRGRWVNLSKKIFRREFLEFLMLLKIFKVIQKVQNFFY